MSNDAGDFMGGEDHDDPDDRPESGCFRSAALIVATVFLLFAAAVIAVWWN